MKKPLFWLIALLFVSLGFRLGFVLFLSTEAKIVQYIGDDPFYYFQLASNLIRGNGTSIDGEIITNGYHPLWVFLISPLFLLRDVDQILPVRLALMLSGVLSVGVGLFLFLIVRKLSRDGWLGLLAAGIYLFTERVFLFDILGEPSALSNLLIAASLYIVARVAVSGRFPPKLSVSFGVLCGLAVLARTDNIAFVGLFYVFILFWADEPKRPLRLAASFVVTLTVVSPWLIWNQAVFGTVLQSSADACPVLFRTLTLGENPGTLDIMRMSVNRALEDGALNLVFGYFPLGFVLSVLIGALVAGYANRNRLKARSVTIILACTGIAFALYYAHAGIALYIRPWHVAFFAVFTALIVTFAIYVNFNGITYKRAIVVISIFYGLFFLFFAPYRLYNPPYQTSAGLGGARYVLEHPEYKFAAYDSGILSYFSDGAILTIDGNVNPGAYRAVKEKRVYEYMKENDVDYFVGYRGWVDKLYSPFWPGDFDEYFEETDFASEVEYGIPPIYRLKK